jgi:ribosomal peptide maturation radical SAM protein 1
MTDIVFVSMPFGPRSTPALGLSLLKSALADCGCSATIHYKTLTFAERIGPARYDRIASGSGVTTDLVGEWIFSSVEFAAGERAVQRYLDEVLGAHAREAFVEDVLEARTAVPAFLDAALDEILCAKPKVVGFTSSFAQHLSSLALARRVKAARPDIFIVFGGANCEGEMGVELVRQFPFVDAVLSGEGDIAIRELVTCHLAGKSVDDVLGAYTRTNIDRFGDGRYPNAAVIRHLDDLPYPDFTDFFAQLQHLSKEHGEPRLLFEASRGCWWGEKRHCTFCGLNGATMAFRSKSPDRAFAELTHLRQAYGVSTVMAVDNILDHTYFKTFLPRLAASDLDVELWVEVKANLRREQVALLKEAGASVIQPGIESLSTSVLALMNKGVTALQNVQLLKWCKEYGLTPVWNLLWGFPGEDAAAYRDMARMIPLLSHLTPPDAAGTIRLDRFSPYFDDPKRYGITNVQPYPGYRHVYDASDAALARLAYYFTFDYVQSSEVGEYSREVADGVAAWRGAHEHSQLVFLDGTYAMVVIDLRPCAEVPVTLLSGVQRWLYRACDAIQSAGQLCDRMDRESSFPLTPEEIHGQLAALTKTGLMLREGDRYLSLALPLERCAPGRAMREHMEAALQTSLALLAW